MKSDFTMKSAEMIWDEFMKKIEQYRVKCPECIMFGNPWDFEHYKAQPRIRDQVVVNYV